MAQSKSSKEILKTLREEFPYLKKKYQVKSLSLFGSYSRNKQNSESDVDILVTFMETPGFLKFIRLENYLTETLGIKVDLVMEDSLKHNIGDRITDEAISV